VTSPLLTVEDLDVTYGDAQALFGVAVQVEASAAVAVLGPNGAGKSSLAAAVGGRVRPARGRIRFDGRDITGWSAHRLTRLGLAFVPEGRAIFPHLSVLENLRVRLRYAVPARERGAALDRAFAAFPILAARRRLPAGTLSGGEQQMLSLARVLAAPPRLLIADEMSLGLAPIVVEVVFDALTRARREGVAVLLVEQYAQRALAFADRAVILRRGHVVWEGPAAEAGGELVAGYLGGP
jgi:branched-chain amino acid transport system ATP-binding protein